MERVVAVVNTQVILESDLRRRMQQAADSAKTAKQTLPPQEVLRKQVLERLVNEQAILQRAASRGIEVDEATIQRAVERIAEQNGLSVTALRNQLEKEGVSFSRFRDDIRDEILISRVREREVDSRVNVATFTRLSTSRSRTRLIKISSRMSSRNREKETPSFSS